MTGVDRLVRAEKLHIVDAFAERTTLVGIARQLTRLSELSIRTTSVLKGADMFKFDFTAKDASAGCGCALCMLLAPTVGDKLGEALADEGLWS